MQFEQKKFVQIRTLADRWDYKTCDPIYALIEEGKIRAWAPSGKAGTRALRIDVESVLAFEKNGYIENQ